MSLTLDLTPDEEARLQSAAARRGLDLPQYARQRLLSPVATRQPRSRLDEAIALFDQEIVSLETGARLAGLSQSAFLDALGKAGVSALQYPVEEALAEADAL